MQEIAQNALNMLAGIGGLVVIYYVGLFLERKK